MSGDMNTSCEPTSQVCGTHVLPIGEYHKQDYRDFLHICEALSLSLLNTWTKPPDGQLATFSFGNLTSQIDYIVVRRQQATPVAKQAGVISEFPVAGWRAGAKHYPVIASITVPKRRWHQDGAATARKPNVAAILEDLKQRQPPERLQLFRSEVESTLHTSEDFDQIMLQTALRHYPPRERPDKPPAQPAELANSARHMWQLFRQMRSHRFDMQGVVQAWKTWVQFSRAHVKARRDDLLHQAQQAATGGNMHELWNVVKRLAPKARFKKVQLHKHGVIMAPEAELEWIASAFGERFGASQSTPPPPLQRQYAPVQLAESEVRQALHQIPARKAVPPGTLPAAFWKACADQLAVPLTNRVNRDWQDPHVEVQQSWAKADVALLPKGKKQVKTPLDLRPIGLQHPIGKTMMKVLISRAREHITSLVRRWPQTAYVPGRSTATALKVVFSHCHGVRTACAQARVNIHQKHEGQATQHKPQQLRGGLQVSLDLTAAFDLVNWRHLRMALASAEIEPSVQELLLQWLRQVVYVFHHKGGSQEVRPAWGLRQGCPASPSLWAVFTALLCQAFDHKFYDGWSAEHAVMYADDSHLRWTFDSYSGFERAVTELRLVMKIFAQFDMQINFKKTQALLLTTGTHKSKIIKHYVRTDSEGKRLLLSPGDPRHWIPLVPQAEYLGLIISYDRFEALSTRHRISKAHQRRWALASILHSRTLAKQYKLHIWRSCVQTTLLYGLHCLGLSQKLVKEIQAACMKHIRAIVSDQQHLTGRTHQEIRESYHIDTALKHLQTAHDREIRLQDGNDWMQQWKWNQHISACFVSLTEDGSAAESDPEQDNWACPHCDSTFSTAAALKIHAQRTHGHRDEPQQLFDKARHSIGGLPTCRFCDKKFSRWQTLARHINYMACPVFDYTEPKSDDPPEQPVHSPMMGDGKEEALHAISLPTPEQPDVLPIFKQPSVQRLARKGLKQFIPCKPLGSYLQQHCALCGQWTATNRVMKLHYRHSHPEVFPQCQKQIGGLIERCATPSIRCLYCDCTQQDWKAHMYKCTTIWQYAVLCVLQDPDYDPLHGAGSGDGRVLRTGGEAQDPLKAAQPGRPEPQAAQGIGVLQVPMAGPRPGGMGSSRAPLRPPSGLKQRSIATFGRPPGLETRGRAEAATTGYQHGSMVQPGPKLAVAASLPDCSSIQEKTGGRPNLGAVPRASETSDGDGHVQGTSRATSQGGELAGLAEEGGGHGMEGCTGVGVSNVEPSASPLGAGPRWKAHSGDGDDKQTRVFHQQYEKGCGAPFPLHPAAHGDNGLQGNLPPGLVSEEQTCRRHLGPDAGVAGMLYLSADRPGISTRTIGQGPGCSETPRHDQVIVRHIFVNHGNSCYMNALVQTITWALLLSGADASVMGRGAEFFNYIANVEQRIDLLQVRGWQDIIAEWTEAQRQHDVCEFLQHVLEYLRAPIFQGTWQARQLVNSEGAVRCIDWGHGTQAIPLHLPRIPPGLSKTLEVQNLVDLWHKDRDRTTCFQAPPKILFLQLMRFTKKHGHISKDRTEVTLSLDLNIPTFTDARLGRSQVHYHLTAYVVHHGLSPKSGHYTAHLLQDGEFWQCDDNRPAQLECTPRRNHLKDVYLLIYTRQ